MKKIYFLIPILLLSFFVFFYMLDSVSNKDEEVLFVVEEGDTYSTLGTTLKEKDLIKSELFYKIYIKMTSPSSLEVCSHSLNKNMNVGQIVKELGKKCNQNPDVISITFKEGLNMRQIAKLISEETSNSENDVFSTLEDKDYLNSLISEYWFLGEEILNDEIYYSLEGYLHPNTYEFANKDVSVKDIFKKLLDETANKLTEFKSSIESSNYSLHEILTLASIVELEAAHSDDRYGVAGVFYNRLEDNWALGSDVTTYYAEKLDMSERDLYVSELNDYNAYNTRSAEMAGELPVGPICNPSLESIKAAISPKNHEFYYFVADKNMKTYFNTTSSGHDATIKSLKDSGLWYTY